MSSSASNPAARRAAPCGTWSSPITAQRIAQGAVRLDEVKVGDGTVYWLESRPSEGGRGVVVRCTPSGAVEDVTPPHVDVGTRIHEYGGGAFFVHGQTLFYSNADDGRLYRTSPGSAPVPVTPPSPDGQREARHADGRTTPDGRSFVCVRERVDGQAVVHELIVAPCDGSRPPQVIVAGADFHASPRVSRDGRRLAWLAWNHPQMPWDGTELWIADLAGDGAVSAPRRVAGGPSESIFQPEWGPDGALYFVSDRSGWWNLYRLRDERVEALCPMEAELGWPQWRLDLGTYAFLDDGSVACLVNRGGLQELLVVADGRAPRALRLPYTSFGFYPTLRGEGRTLCFVAAGDAAPPAVVRCEVDTGRCEVLRESVDEGFDRRFIPIPRPVEFPSGDVTVHALYYPPTNPDFETPAGELPPLIVSCHGGPTLQAITEVDLETVYWTSRGFAVVDVNYAGSSGFGRAFRERLRGAWGIADVEDCAAAARFLARGGIVDSDRCLIRGGSAGGLTALCALAKERCFLAASSSYGVVDLESLAASTHAFESRYVEGLVGPYPAMAALYRERSPRFLAGKMRGPVLLLQGLEDEVVPPSQARALAAELRALKVPHALIEFPGEGHGFRRAETIRAALEAELAFFTDILGLEQPELLSPVPLWPPWPRGTDVP